MEKNIFKVHLQRRQQQRQQQLRQQQQQLLLLQQQQALQQQPWHHSIPNVLKTASSTNSATIGTIHPVTPGIGPMPRNFVKT